MACGTVSTSFDAAMPMTPRCQPRPPTTRTLCAPTAGIGFDRLLGLRDEIGFFRLALQVLVAELLRERAGLVAHRFVGGEQQARGDVGRAHAPGGVDARRDHEADVIAVDRLAGESAGIEQRAQPDRVRPLGEGREAVPGDDPVLADERHDVGERADARRS